jgi:hypothetical protein
MEQECAILGLGDKTVPDRFMIRLISDSFHYFTIQKKIFLPIPGSACLRPDRIVLINFFHTFKNHIRLVL